LLTRLQATPSDIAQTPERSPGNVTNRESAASQSRTGDELLKLEVNAIPLKVLVVDDNEALRNVLAPALEAHNFRVTTAADVGEALHLIDTEPFDVLISDLQMPGAGDGYTVVSAMRHKNPKALTFVLSGYPALKEAMAAILSQADEVLLKPMPIVALVALIRDRSTNRETQKVTNTERVATILERESASTISEWLLRVKADPELARLPISDAHRTGHLPQLLDELVQRLRVPRPLGTQQVSECAVKHGKVRRTQGYSIPMIIEESRILQVSIFDTLQKNLRSVDFSLLLTDVMTIADECDSQLKQTIISFTEGVASIAA
jgi:DNA-binding response OmpR family regulator